MRSIATRTETHCARRVCQINANLCGKPPSAPGNTALCEACSICHREIFKVAEGTFQDPCCCGSNFGFLIKAEQEVTRKVGECCVRFAPETAVRRSRRRWEPASTHHEPRFPEWKELHLHVSGSGWLCRIESSPPANLPSTECRTEKWRADLIRSHVRSAMIGVATWWRHGSKRQ